MKAVVMAGGEGSRLRPITANRPKPLAPVVNRPIMEHILLLLKQQGSKAGRDVQFTALGACFVGSVFVSVFAI